MNKIIIILILILSLIINIVNAAQITGYFVVEPNSTYTNIEEKNNEKNIEEKKEIPPITSSTVKEQENNLFNYIKNFFVKIFSFFKK